MTTNAGASDMAKEGIGFGRRCARARTRTRSSGCSRRSSATGWTRSSRSPALTPEIVGRVVEKFVMQLEAQLADRNVTIELSSGAKEWLAERGYDRCMARGRWAG